MDRNSDTSRDGIRQEAAEWVIRLTANSTGPERARFEVWRGQSIDHEIAFERELATWERMDQLRDAPHSDRRDEPPASLDVPPTPEPARRSWGWRRLAASLALITGVGAMVATTLTTSPAYATMVGETRLVRLEDGSSVELNTNSKIIVHYTSGKRQIELVRGEALFHVSGGARPFMIRVGEAQLDANRSDVAVRIDSGQTLVTVSKGTVLASRTSDFGSGQAVSPIGIDSEARVSADGIVIHQVSDEDIQRSLAWLKGGISLDGRTLSQAVAEFNRYNRRQITIVDQDAGQIHVGGYFRTSDVDGFVAALTTAFPVKAATTPDGGITLAST